ncbi:MAG: OmpA family protein [Cyclobacteriaceae bacterium]
MISKDKPNLTKTFILTLLLFSICKMGNAQNLIPNSSFEDGDCPYGFTRKPEQFSIDSWVLPDNGTPDYYNRCADNEAGIPYNWSGVINPNAGDGHIGIYLKKGRLYQENIGVKLKQPLLKDSTYYGRFFVAIAANSQYAPCEISIALRQNPLSIDLKGDFEFREQTFSIPESEEFMDFNWKAIEFAFVADGNENYFYVGSLSNMVRVCEENLYRYRKEPMLNNASYVYLDNFYLGTNKDYKEPVPVFEFAEEITPLNVYFDFDEDLLLPKVMMTLDSLVEFVSGTDYHLLITGGTDSLGTDEYNRELGLKRANAVKEYLIFMGVNPQRTGTKSAGETNPTYPNHTEESRSLNRTVLLEFYKESIEGE